MIEEGQEIVRACLRRGQPGPFQVQAAINAVHCDAARAEDTDWPQILALYDQLLALEPTAVVALNRAVALAEVHGCDQALPILDELAETLGDYGPYHAVRADLLRRAGRGTEALTAFDQAIERAGNAGEREFLRRRRAGLQAVIRRFQLRDDPTP
jgi:RNA polymerase sigma-70 factor (ECF subfamily)